MAEPDGIKVADTSIFSVVSVDLEDDTDDPPFQIEAVLDRSASPNQEVSGDEIFFDATSIPSNKSDAAAPKDDGGDGGSDSSIVVDAAASGNSFEEGKRTTDSPSDLKVDPTINQIASDEPTASPPSTDDMAMANCQTTSDDLNTSPPATDDMAMATSQTTSDDLNTNETSSDVLTDSTQTTADALTNNQPTTEDIPTSRAVEPNVEKDKEATLCDSQPSLPELKSIEDQDELDVNDNQGGEDEQDVVEDNQGGGDEQDADVVKDKPDTIDERVVVKDNKGGEHERDVLDKPDSADERAVTDKPGAKDEDDAKDKNGAVDEEDAKDKPKTVDERAVSDKLASEDKEDAKEKQDAVNERAVSDKLASEDKEDAKEKQDAVDDKQGTEDVVPLPLAPMELKLEDEPEVAESVSNKGESLKEAEDTDSLGIDQREAVQAPQTVASSDSPTAPLEFQEKCDSPVDLPVADTAVVPYTDECRAEAASPSAQRKVLSYATFKPIVPGDVNISNEEDDSKSLLTALDLPKLDDVSVATSNDESSGCISSENVKLDGEAVANDIAPGNDDGEQIRPRAPNPAKPSMSSDSSDGYSTSSDSFKQRREPDGDCDFLDQTLNISAIETSMQFSESCTTTDMPSLVMSAMGEQTHGEIVEDVVHDAPGEVVQDESRITSDHSLLLLKSNGSGDEDVAPSAAAVKGDEHEAKSEGIRESIGGFQGKPNLNGSVGSLTSYISAEHSWEAIELIRAPSYHVNPAGETQSAAEVVSAEDQSKKICRTTATPLFNCHQRLRGCSPTIVPGANCEPPNVNDPLISRLSKTTSCSSHTPTGDTAKTALTKTTVLRVDPDDDANTPIARMRNSQAEGLAGRPTTDPDGAVVDKQDSFVLGGLRKPSIPRPDDRPRPRVSFASMHKGPHYTRHERFPSPRLHRQCEDEEQRSSVSAEEVRRSRFAAYLRRRMIDYDDDDEDPRLDDQDEIPRILDPNTMCTSVESSFSTLISKTEAANERDTVQSAPHIVRSRSKPDYADDSDSDSSYCTDSDDSSEEDDAKSLGYFLSFFTEPETAGDSNNEMFANNETYEAVAKWCEDIPLPTAPQLEDLLKVATDFGFSNQTMKVTEKPHCKDQEALSDFVEELENEEPLEDDRGNSPRGQESILAVPVAAVPAPVLSKPKARRIRKPEPDLQTTLSADAQAECGVLTLQDFHELAMMAAEAIAARTKQMQSIRPLTLRIQRKDTNTSTDSTEEAWECVEHTVNDLESVTGTSVTGTSLQQEKSNVQDRIKAKLEHIKKTQPQVYKVFLAKMAAAEKSGRRFDFHRDDMILKGSSPMKEKAPEPRSKVENEPQRENLKDLKAESEPVSARAPRISVKIEVESAAPQSSPSWESFDGSPFKEPGIKSHSSASTEFRDDSSVFDDFKWLSSAKESFTSTVGSFIDGPKKMARPLRTRFAQYSKTHPNLYRMLLEKVNEGDTLKPRHHPVVEEPNAAGENTESEPDKAASRSKTGMKMQPNESCNPANKNTSIEEGSQVEVTEADFASEQEQGTVAPIQQQRQEHASGMVRPKLQPTNELPSQNVIVKVKRSPDEESTHSKKAPTDSCRQPHTPRASLHIQTSAEVCTPPARGQDVKMTPTIRAVKASTVGVRSEEEPSHAGNQKLHQARPKESIKQGLMVGDREPGLRRELFRDIADSQTKKMSLKTTHSAETKGAEEDPKQNFAKKVKSTSAKTKGEVDDPKRDFAKKVESVPGQTKGAEEDPKRIFAKKVEFFTKRISPVQKQDSVVLEAKEEVGTSRVGSRVSMFSAAKERSSKMIVEATGRLSSASDAQRTATSEKEKPSPLDAESSLNAGRLAGIERSKTPLSSNRTFRGKGIVAQKETKKELLGTPVHSNRYESHHTRPPAIRSTMTSGKTKKVPQTAKSSVTLPGTSAPKPEPKQRVKHDNDNQPLPSPATSSQWESFEGSSFKGFVFQSLTGTTSEQADKGAGVSTPNGRSTQIDLQATFLDSILPAPPSFPSHHSEMHSRRDPWDFSEAAGEQWEHFSPLSFDSNFTNWGLKERPTPAPSSSTTRRRTTKASPASVAEF